MDMNYLSPYVRLAWDNIVPAPATLHERVIFDYELLYVKSGEIEVTVEGRKYHGIPGDIFFFQPKQTHSFTIIGDKPLRQPHIHFDLFYKPDSPDIKVSFKTLRAMSENERKLFRESLGNNIFDPFPCHVRLQNTLTFEKILFEIIYEFNNHFPFYEIVLKGLFIQLWTHFLREIYWSNNLPVVSNMALINKLKSYLDHSLDTDITLDQMSEYTHLSKYYLSHLFKKTFGTTPVQYHLMARINKAKEIIQFSTLSIKEVAEKLGFQNIYTFSRVFKKIENVPPTFYRR